MFTRHLSATQKGISMHSDPNADQLAFEVDELTEGDYILVNFHVDPVQIAELDRVLRINDAVKRHMIVARTDKV